MNEKYTTLSTTANVVQAVLEVMKRLDPANVTIPSDTTVIVQDIQAAVNRNLAKGVA